MRSKEEMTLTFQSVKECVRTLRDAARLGIDYDAGRITMDEVRAAFAEPAVEDERDQHDEWASREELVMSRAN